MDQKIFRDPLYNYIAVDRQQDGWLIDLINCPEVQRLRRITQLGVSSYTYPGASHSRFSHTLGVLHLMQQMYQRAEACLGEAKVKQARNRLLAAAVLHDVGHGPFSHLFEPCLGIKHEAWSIKIVRDPESRVHQVLRDRVDRNLPGDVADLIDEKNAELPQWEKYLLSSQLDADRMDYLRRDSLFTGGGYGHFDRYRLVNTFELYPGKKNDIDIVWPEKAKFAIEEYIFSRFYMYQNVYQHKTTRGIEALLQAMWKRAKFLRDDGTDVQLVAAIKGFWAAGDNATCQQYLRMEEFTVLEQIQRWTDSDDAALQDLARRFLCRDQMAMIVAPDIAAAGGLQAEGARPYAEWEAALHACLAKQGIHDPETYCLKDELKRKYNQPYFPEKQGDEQSAKNAIRILQDGEPVEISRVLDRLQPVTQEEREPAPRYYVPREAREAVEALRRGWG